MCGKTKFTAVKHLLIAGCLFIGYNPNALSIHAIREQ